MMRHRRTQPSSPRGNVRVTLVSGRKLVAGVSGAPPPFLKINVPPEGKTLPGSKPLPGRAVMCRRVDLERYVEMTGEDLVKAGLAKDPDDEGLDRQPSPLV